jgi:hypothetical protein
MIAWRCGTPSLTLAQAGEGKKFVASEAPSIAEDMHGRQVACHYAARVDLPGIGQPTTASTSRRPDKFLPEGNN